MEQRSRHAPFELLCGESGLRTGATEFCRICQVASNVPDSLVMVR